MAVSFLSTDQASAAIPATIVRIEVFEDANKVNGARRNGQQTTYNRYCS